MTRSEEKKFSSERSGHPGLRRLEQFAFSMDGIPSVLDEDAFHIKSCGVCADRVANMRDERALFIESHPSESLIQRIDAQEADQGRFESIVYRLSDSFERFKPLVAVAAVVLLVSALVFVLVNNSPKMGTPDRLSTQNSIGIKGANGVNLDVYVKRSDQPFTLFSSDEPLIEGDILRFSVRSSESGYVAIASIDDRGLATMYFPSEPNHAFELKESRSVLIEDSIVLDDFLGEELIVAIVAKAKPDRETVLGALSKAWVDAGGDLNRIEAIKNIEGYMTFKRITKIEP